MVVVAHSRSLTVAAGLAAALQFAGAPTRDGATQASESLVFTNARVITGIGPRAFEPDDVALLVRYGRIDRVAPMSRLQAPSSARVVDLAGRFVVPGFVTAHAHVSDVNGLGPRAYTEENTRRQLALYARYGITTVLSLGGEQAPAFAARGFQDAPSLQRARLFVAGTIVTARTPDEARQAVARAAESTPDIVKIRVDDNLGSTTKMPPEIYRAVIEEAHARKLRVAAHIFYLDDAKDLLRAGVDLIAHSVRDRDIDDEFVQLMKTRRVPYCPTLTREISAFVYQAAPPFFSDPFFLREADPEVVAQLRQPERQRSMAASTAAARYKAGLTVAMRNLKRAAAAGVFIAMGTDSGASAERFQGYFEHLEMAMMAEAGMSAQEVLRASTIGAAEAAGRTDIGALAPGRWADFVVLRANPLLDIRNTTSVESVYVAGNRVPPAVR